MNALADGRYDVFLLDGEVLALRGPHLAPDAVTLIGLPATLVVSDGTPKLALDRA
jgi:hypothetical protein